MASDNLVQAVGDDADAVIRAAAVKHFASLFGSSHELREADTQRTIAAIAWAIAYWVDILLGYINTQGSADTYGSQQLSFRGHSVRCWLEDKELTAELLRTMVYPEHDWLPRVDVLEAANQRAQPVPPPHEYAWPYHVRAFRSGMGENDPLDARLRESLQRFL